MEKPTRDECLDLLRAVAEETGRLPRKSDFPLETMVYIKSYYGPWPRALEAAGLKEPRHNERIAKNREKRARVKERRKLQNTSSAAREDDINA